MKSSRIKLKNISSTLESIHNTREEVVFGLHSNHNFDYHKTRHEFKNIDTGTEYHEPIDNEKLIIEAIKELMTEYHKDNTCYKKETNIDLQNLFTAYRFNFRTEGDSKYVDFNGRYSFGSKRIYDIFDIALDHMILKYPTIPSDGNRGKLGAIPGTGGLLSVPYIGVNWIDKDGNMSVGGSHKDRFESAYAVDITRDKEVYKYLMDTYPKEYIDDIRKYSSNVSGKIGNNMICGEPDEFHDSIETTDYKIGSTAVKAMMGLCPPVTAILNTLDRDVEDKFTYKGITCPVGTPKEWGTKSPEDKDIVVISHVLKHGLSLIDKVGLYAINADNKPMYFLLHRKVGEDTYFKRIADILNIRQLI